MTSDLQRVPLGSQSPNSWFGLVHGVPMLFSRSPALDEHLPDLRRWLVEEKEPDWRALPQDDRWPYENERSQLTSKYTRYNALAAALSSSDTRVAAAAAALRQLLLERLVDLMRRFPAAVDAMAERDVRDAWRRRLRQAPDSFQGMQFPQSVHVQSWMNAHRANASGEQSLSLHDHSVGWHGYLLIDAAPSLTAYMAPDATAGGGNALFALNNTNGVLVLLCGGLRHAVLPLREVSEAASQRFVGGRPRVSMAFDLALSTRVAHKGNAAYEHPAAKGSTNVASLDESGSINAWHELASPKELKAVLRKQKLDTPMGFDFASVQKAYPAVPRFGQLRRDLEQLDPHDPDALYGDDGRGREGVRWGGMVDLAALVGSFDFADRAQEEQHVHVHEEL